jgi:DNA polymerase III alpha subunit (gram-positive type)
MSKLLFFDLETTGVKFWRNGIHQIGGIVGIDGQEAERFDIRLAPNPAATIEQEALDVAGVTLEQVQSYQPMEEGYRQLVGILSKYVNKFDKRDKMYLVMTVAKTMGIEIDENKLHDATYDIELTRDIFYKIINKMDVKL